MMLEVIGKLLKVKDFYYFIKNVEYFDLSGLFGFGLIISKGNFE